MDIQRAENRFPVPVPAYEEIIQEPERMALFEHLKEDLTLGNVRPELSRLWQQVHEPGYHYYPEYRERTPAPTPVPKRPRAQATGARRTNPYLVDKRAEIDSEPFASFGREDVGAHYRNAWRAVLALAGEEIGEHKVTTRTEGEEWFTCKVRIVTPRNSYRFSYEVDGSEADRDFYDHIAQVAEGEGLSAAFETDWSELDDAVVVTYGSRA